MANILWDFPILRKRIRKWIINKEGGEKTSETLRINSQEKNKVTVGIHSYGSCFCDDFNLGGTVSIGRYCSFGPGVRYFGANHPMHYSSMSPYFYNSTWGYEVKDVPRHRLVVENDVWIGANVVITCGCHRIGNGAVVAAGSVVTKDISDYAIVGGNPARVIKYRFPEEERKVLLASKWWEKEPDELIKCYQWIDNPCEWVKCVGEL